MTTPEEAAAGAGAAPLRRGAAVVRRFFTAPVGDVRRASLRVALITTALVLAAYIVIAAAVLMIVTRNLTTAVDDRLQHYLAAIVGVATPRSNLPSSGPAYAEPLFVWVVTPDGQVSPVAVRGANVAASGQQLPPQADRVTTPVTLTLGDGDSFRLAGATTDLDVRVNGVPVVVSNAHVVVGQSLDTVAQTQKNILIAELSVGPALLVAIFFGALTIGRRVAAPIERMRQRQVALTADASHELRTPLSVIEAQTSLALERERDAEWYRRAFAAVGVESKRMRRLVDDLLWLARFDDSSSAAPAREPVDLGVLATSAAARFAAVAEARGQVLRVAVEPVLTVVNAPPEWLDRLLGVLLDNACRYTPAGGRIDVSVGRREGRVRLAVDDSGPGIPPEERASIFDRFHRASDAPGGSGLGLAIAAAIVSASGGRWEVGESASGGASMAVSWQPMLRGSPAEEDAPEGEPARSRSTAALTPPPPPRTA
ncbi:MAG: sensor histidine kinase [Candidatus Dormibacteria bacterium]